MLEVLKMFEYSAPKIEAAKFDNFEVNKNSTNFNLKVNGRTWMEYYFSSHIQAAQVFSHYYLAKDRVIVTGLGFAARENWLLTNKNLKSLTIIEANQSVIDFHRKIKTPVLEKSTIINCNASEYSGECDTLLLDHYELEPMELILNDVYKITKRIAHQTMWFWPLENKIIADCHGVDVNTIHHSFRENQFEFDMKSLVYINDVYQRIKNSNNLHTLPNLTDDELRLFVTMFTGFFQYL